MFTRHPRLSYKDRPKVMYDTLNSEIDRVLSIGLLIATPNKRIKKQKISITSICNLIVKSHLFQTIFEWTGTEINKTSRYCEEN